MTDQTDSSDQIDNQTLYNLIQAQYQLNHDGETAFLEICKQLDYESVPAKYLKKWRKRIKGKNFMPYCQEDDHQNQFKVFMQIFDLYFKFDNALLWKKDEKIDRNFDFLPDNPRYGLKCWIENDKCMGLEVMDYFYGKVRPLSFSTNSPLPISNDPPKFYIYIIDSKKVLIEESSTNNTTLHLISIDFKKFECQLMDSNKDFESSFGIILDELDCQRFALIKYKKNPNKFNEIDVWATKGWIENEKIVVDKEKIKITSYYNQYDAVEGLRLIGNQISGIYFGVSLDIDTIVSIGFWTRNLDEPYSRPQPNYSFKHDSNNWNGCPNIYAYVWSDSTCYMALNGYYDESDIYIIAFNTKTFERKAFAFLPKSEKVSDLCLDESKEVLFVKSEECIYKVPLVESNDPKVPKKLEEIIWAQIKKESLFNKSTNLNEKLMEKLPTNCEYRPFYFKDL